MAEPTDQPAHRPEADGPAPNPDVPARLTRIEENAAFAAHEAEQLAEHVRTLMATLDRLGRRVEAIEARLRRADAAAEAHGDVSPEP